MNSDNIATSSVGSGGLTETHLRPVLAVLRSMEREASARCRPKLLCVFDGATADQDPMSSSWMSNVNPNDNLYGTILGAHDNIDSQMAAAAASAQTESVANQGFKSQVKCVDSYIDENGNTICTKPE